MSANPTDAGVDRNVEIIEHLANIEELSKAKLKLGVIDCIDKATSLLSKNIGDDSRYLMFEWNVADSVLVVVVTDDAKENDSEHVVKCSMTSHADEMKKVEAISVSEWENKTQEFSETVRDWIHNYLTTCAAFMQFSLIAVFHNESRKQTRLL